MIWREKIARKSTLGWIQKRIVSTETIREYGKLQIQLKSRQITRNKESLMLFKMFILILHQFSFLLQFWMLLLARLPCKVQFWTEGFLKKLWTGQPRLFMIQTLALWLRLNELLGGTSIYWNLIWFNWSEWILVNHAVVSKMARFHQLKYISTYPKVASSSMSRLVAHFQIFRRLMKGKFDAYVVCVTFGQKVPKLNSRPVYCSQLYGTLNNHCCCPNLKFNLKSTVLKIYLKHILCNT